MDRINTARMQKGAIPEGWLFKDCDDKEKATKLNAQFLNGMMMELMTIIYQSKQTPLAFDKDKPESYSQVYNGIKKIVVNTLLETPRPIVVSDCISTNQGETVTIDVKANDLISGVTIIDDRVSEQGTHGTAAFVNGQIQYTPQGDYSGTDHFKYELKDELGHVLTAIVSVIIFPALAEKLAEQQQQIDTLQQQLSDLILVVNQNGSDIDNAQQAADNAKNAADNAKNAADDAQDCCDNSKNDISTLQGSVDTLNAGQCP